MPYIIPSREMSIEKKENYRKDIVRQMFASHFSGDWGIYDLCPQDFSLRTWKTLPSAGVDHPDHRNAYRIDHPDEWIDHSVTHDIYIYKILNLSTNPAVSSISFMRGNATMLAKFELESCYAGLPIMENLAGTLENDAKRMLNILAGIKDTDSEINVSPELGSPMEGWFSEPVSYSTGSFVRILTNSNRKSEGDYLVLGGFKLAIKGEISTL